MSQTPLHAFLLVQLRKLAKEKEALERIATERFNKRDTRHAKATNMHNKVMNQEKNLERQLYESDINQVESLQFSLSHFSIIVFFFFFFFLIKKEKERKKR